MIHPRMATMLSVVLTDATVAPDVLWGLLRPAAARTWDQLSVDGDTSTNDTVFVLASGAAGAAPVGAGSAAAVALGAAHRGGRARPGTPAGGRRRGRDDAHHRLGDRGTGRCRGTGRGAFGHLVEPGQGGGPRPRPELGPDRGRGRQRPAGRRGRARGGRPGGRRGRGPCRYPGRARPGDAPDRDRRPPRVRRRRRAARSPSTARRPAPRWTPPSWSLPSTSVWAAVRARPSAATSPRRT